MVKGVGNMLNKKQTKKQASLKKTATKSKTKRKIYKSEFIATVVNLKKLQPDLSNKKISKALGVSESTLKRWFKKPNITIQKAQIKEVKRSVNKIDKAKLAKLEKKLLTPTGTQYRLRVVNKDGSFSVIS